MSIAFRCDRCNEVFDDEGISEWTGKTIDCKYILNVRFTSVRPMDGEPDFCFECLKVLVSEVLTRGEEV